MNTTGLCDRHADVARYRLCYLCQQKNSQAVLAGKTNEELVGLLHPGCRYRMLMYVKNCLLMCVDCQAALQERARREMIP